MLAGADGGLFCAATGEMAAVSKPSVSKLGLDKPGVIVNRLQAFLAVVLGNVVYFAIAPSLPAVARHRPFHMDLGIVVDFWFCLVTYGSIRTARKWK